MPLVTSHSSVATVRPLRLVSARCPLHNASGACVTRSAWGPAPGVIPGLLCRRCSSALRFRFGCSPHISGARCAAVFGEPPKAPRSGGLEILVRIRPVGRCAGPAFVSCLPAVRGFRLPAVQLARHGLRDCALLMKAHAPGWNLSKAWSLRTRQSPCRLLPGGRFQLGAKRMDRPRRGNIYFSA